MSKNLRNNLHVYGAAVQVPHHLHFGQEMLDRMLQYRQYHALINADTGEKMTFLELAQQTVNIALSLTRLGVGVGDVVSISSEKRMEIIPTILAAFCAGAAFAPVEVTYKEGPLLHRMNIAKPKVMFCSPTAYKTHKDTFKKIDSIKHLIVYGDVNHEVNSFKDFLTESAEIEDYVPTEVDGTKDVILILFSSGTTGLPKGVPWTHLGFLVNTVSCVNESFEHSTMLNTREWYYTYGLFTTISSLRKGCTIVFTPRNQEENWWRAVQEYQIKILQLTPISIVEAIKSTILDEYNVTSVESIFSSSTPVFSDQVEAISKRLKKLKAVYQIYGLSEAGGACNEFYTAPRPGSVGRPSHGFQFKVVDVDTRETLGPNQKGEICFKSPSVTKGYLGINNEQYFDLEGFFKSGDFGYYDDDHYFYVINRIKELIKYNDWSIAPAELESILLQHPQVREAAVCGLPHYTSGEAPAALIVTQHGAILTDTEIITFLHDRVPSKWRLAGGVKFVDKLPRGAGDKIDRKALKLMFES